MKRALVLGLALTALAVAQNIRVETFPSNLIEQRLKLATADNNERYQRLRKLFVESNCEVEEKIVIRRASQTSSLLLPTSTQ